MSDFNSMTKNAQKLPSLPHAVHRSSLLMPSSSWDPLRIILQMIILQSLYYIGMIIFGIMFPVSPSFTWKELMDWIFNVDYVDIKKYPGYTLGCILSYSPLWMSLCIVTIVGKARHCWDFAATTLFYHWLFSWHHERSLSVTFSFSYTWWIIHISSTLFTTLLSERWCLYYELQPIVVSENYHYTRLGFSENANPFKSIFASIHKAFSLASTSIAIRVFDFFKGMRSRRFLVLKRTYRRFWLLWTRPSAKYTFTTIYDLDCQSEVEAHRAIVDGSSIPLSHLSTRSVTHTEPLTSFASDSVSNSSAGDADARSSAYKYRLENV